MAHPSPYTTMPGQSTRERGRARINHVGVAVGKEYLGTDTTFTTIGNSSINGRILVSGDAEW